MVKKDNMNEIKKDLDEINNRIERLEGNVTDQVKDFATQMRGRAVEKKEEVEQKVAEHPFQSVGIAFGTGILAGMVAKHFMQNKK